MNKQKNELIIALRQVASHMLDVSEMLAEFKTQTPYPQQRAKELAGASLMVRDWAEEVELINDKL